MRHNHVTRDIRSNGSCPACNHYLSAPRNRHFRAVVNWADRKGWWWPLAGGMLTGVVPLAFTDRLGWVWALFAAGVVMMTIRPGTATVRAFREYRWLRRYHRELWQHYDRELGKILDSFRNGNNS